MTYEQAIAYLNALIDYERAPDFNYGAAFKLDRAIALMEALGRPERAWSALHVAGTKGKGSVATYLDALLRAHGAHTGLYTSPHLVSFRERVRIDGRQIPEAIFTDVMTVLEPWATRWQEEHPDSRLSFFDVLTGIGFEAFRRAHVGWGVVEVGMGGRLDATNVVQPRAVVITPIALEHTKYLGDTIAAIAREKAGVIKPGIPVVVGPQVPEARAVIVARAVECDADVTRLGRPGEADADVVVDESDDAWSLRADGIEFVDLRLRALGRHQRWNFAAAVVALNRAGVELDPRTVGAVAAETTIPGRLHLIPGDPPMLLDVAHTPDSARMLVRVLEEHFPGRRTTLIFGCANDKRVAEVARVLAPAVERVLLVQLPGSRAMPMNEMLPAWRAAHPFVRDVATVAAALENARATTPSHGLIVACGSFILVGAAMEALGYAPD